MLGATVLNLALIIGFLLGFIALYALIFNEMHPVVFIMILGASVFLSYIIYRNFVLFLNKKFKLEKYVDRIFGRRGYK